ncbi:MOSC domain-containing protein [Paucibacter sp. XJ19-41]|uniref:MOSC domain-containing protein n=1 Tax=Paucibacter sp. XJ19-41 TaxID=2927824 RepID=UPI00234A523F|nr:MOSC domain-containing protein [Paucibacter sp. XJ19-41]MDC6168872.1 MOSC domain-containing protein [Paucibacter sp. XJ19-41]
MKLLSINTAPAQALLTAQGSVLSGIRKQPQSGPVAVAPLGLAGDEQADLSVHGGLAKAVYAYPVEHYPFWQTVRAQARVAGWDEALAPGSMGENLSLQGLLESQVWIGDILRFADCELVVSEPRFPCFKFNAVMGFNQAAKLMTQNAWCGFYLAVQRPGSLSAGESFELIAGPREVGVTELFKARTSKKKN